ncbi:MAG: signal peptidase I [Longispora sp.]|nr:signal peptidase I [Longispora sp. (in: high G+C Gram-positive bacteria)]
MRPGGDRRIGWWAKLRGWRQRLTWWQEFPILIVIAFCIAVLFRTFLVQVFYIPSGSMEDTLRVGDRVAVNKLSSRFVGPVRGEVVVFRGDAGWTPEITSTDDSGLFGRVGHFLGSVVGISQASETDFIKRVIGLPGDVVACCDVRGRVMVNGHPLDEPYVTDNSPFGSPGSRQACRVRAFGPLTVSPGHVFVMGDHREISRDSRCNGEIPMDNIIGRAFVVVWPPSNWEPLPVPDNFRQVPNPRAFAVQALPADVAAADVSLFAPVRAVSLYPSRSVRRRLLW